MVNEQIAARDVKDPRVLDAMRKVPRHRFVPPALISRAYDDSPLPISHSSRTRWAPSHSSSRT